MNNECFSPTAKDVIDYVSFLYKFDLQEVMKEFFDCPYSIQIEEIMNWVEVQNEEKEDDEYYD